MKQEPFHQENATQKTKSRELSIQEKLVLNMAAQTALVLNGLAATAKNWHQQLKASEATPAG